MSSRLPQIRNRTSGWTSDRRAAFLAALGELGSVERAAVHVGLSASSAYRLRKQARGADFALDWDATLAQREGRLFEKLMDRVVERHAPAYYRGRVIGERVVASDRLLLRVLDRTMQRRAPRSRDEAATDFYAAVQRLRDGDKFNGSAQNPQHS